MQVASTHSLRERLEGRWHVLEATRLRYRGLVALLGGWQWRAGLRRNLPLLHLVVLAQPVVDAVLQRALRRSEAEGWPARDETTRLVKEVAQLQAELQRQAARRLRKPAGRSRETGRGEQSDRARAEAPPADRDGLADSHLASSAAPVGHGTADSPSPSLTALLLDLETLLATEQVMIPGQNWAAAQELLPWSLPELLRASERGELLERLMKRPLEPSGPLPFSREEIDLLSSVVPEAETALEEVWSRVDQLEPTGALHRFLARRARGALKRPPRSGPEALHRAAFWVDYAQAVVRAWVEPKVAPVLVSGSELWPLLRWFKSLESNPEARLEAKAPLTDARAGLLELAHELQLFNPPVLPNRLGRMEGRNRIRPEIAPARWERLRRRALRAEPLRDTPEAAGVRHLLTRFIRLRASVQTGREVALEDTSLETLVNQAAAVP
ncbi:MAG: hypothetical protein M3Y59_00715 [Myxococcota bacterium]|nr:hypothetical protein [Myxococcota bacterium]